MKLWNLATGLPGPHLSNYGESPTAIALSSDGSFLATAASTISVWDTSSGQETVHFDAQTEASISDLAVSSDGKRVLRLDKDGNAEVWDAGTGSRVATITCPRVAGSQQSDTSFDLGHVALRDDGKAGLVSWPDGRIALWSENTAAAVCDTRSRPANFVLFDGNNPVVVLDKPEPFRASLPSGSRETVEGKLPELSGVTILGKLQSPIRFNGWTDFTANAGSHWSFQAVSDKGTAALARDIAGGQNAPVYAFTLAVDQAYVGVTRGDVRAVAHALNAPRTATASGRTVTVSGGDQPSRTYRFPDEVQRVAISPDGETIAAIGDDAGWVWRKDDPSAKSLDGLHRPHSVAFSPDGKFLVTADGSDQDAVSIWNIQASKPATQKPATQTDKPDVQADRLTATQLTGHDDEVRQALFLSNDRIVSVSDDGTVRFWRVTAGQRSEEAANRIAFPSGSQLISISVENDGRRAAILGSTGQVYLLDLNANRRPWLVWPSKTAVAAEFSPDGSKLVIVARETDDGAPSGLPADLRLVALPVPGATDALADTRSSWDEPTYPYRGGMTFEDGSHLLLATGEGLLRADIDHPPKIKVAPDISDRELVQLSDMLVANRRSYDELYRIASRLKPGAAPDQNAAEVGCNDNIEPCLKAVQDHPSDPAAWRKLAVSQQAPQALRGAAQLVGAIEGDTDLAEQFVDRLSRMQSLGPTMSQWFLFGSLRSDQPVSAALVADLLANGSVTPDQSAELRTTFEARAKKQDAGADAALALLVLQGSPTTQEMKQALQGLLIAERLAPDQRRELPRAVLRANLARALTPKEALDIQVVANETRPGRAAPSEPVGGVWSPSLGDVDLQSESGQLKLFELAFQRLREEWRAEPKLDLLEALIRIELAGDVLGSGRADAQAKAAARDVLASAIHQLGKWPETLTQAVADARALLGVDASNAPGWDDVFKMAHDFEASEPELAARAFAYVVRRSGESATDEHKISPDLIAAFQESQSKLLHFIAGGIGQDLIVNELAPETWRWWIVGRKILNVDSHPAEAADFFGDTAALLRVLATAKPKSADLARYLTDALDWYAIAGARSGRYARLPLAQRLDAISAAEQLARLDRETGRDRMGEAGDIFFKQILGCRCRRPHPLRHVRSRSERCQPQRRDVARGRKQSGFVGSGLDRSQCVAPQFDLCSGNLQANRPPARGCRGRLRSLGGVSSRPVAARARRGVG